MSQLDYDTYYHIYNRGNNKENLFIEKDNYPHFLRLLQKYILLIADIYCYALMKNHFHLLVRIKEESEIDFLAKDYSNDASKKWRTISSKEIDDNSIEILKLKKPVPSRQFSHLFNSYSKWFSNKYDRTGSLFQKNFKKKKVESEEYLKQLVYYIHHNPIHHGFSNNFNDYLWTSYKIYTEEKPTFLDKDTVIEWFDDLENFIFFHHEAHNLSMFDEDLFE